MHFNPFHDPKNGQFTTGGSGGVIGSLRRRMSGVKSGSKKQEDDTDDEETKKLKYEEAKQKALKEGNATEVLKFKNDLSIQELQNAFSRINIERNLMRISKEELDAGKSTAERFFDKVGKVANYTNSASNLIEATKRFAKNISKEEDSLSQQIAKEFLDKNRESLKSDPSDESRVKNVNDYLNKIANIERIAKGQNGKNK